MDMSRIVTVDMILKNNPCRRFSHRSDLMRWSRNKESLTLEEVLQLAINVEDKIWVLTLPEVMLIAERLEFVQKLATLVHESRCRIMTYLPAGYNPDEFESAIERLESGETAGYRQNLMFQCYMDTFNVLSTEYALRHNVYPEDYEAIYDQMILEMLVSL